MIGSPPQLPAGFSPRRPTSASAAPTTRRSALAPRRRAGGHAGLGRRADRRPRPARPRLGLAAGQSLSLAAAAARLRAGARPRSSASSPPRARPRRCRRCCRPALRLRCKWPNDVLVDGPRSPASCSKSRDRAERPVDWRGASASASTSPAIPPRRRLSRPPRSRREGVGRGHPAPLLAGLRRRFAALVRDAGARRASRRCARPGSRAPAGSASRSAVRLERETLQGRFATSTTTAR